MNSSGGSGGSAVVRCGPGERGDGDGDGKVCVHV